MSQLSYKSLFRFSTAFEISLMSLSVFLALVSGALLPLTTLVFGNLIDSFTAWDIGNITGKKSISADDLYSLVVTNALYFVYLAIGTFFTTYVFMALAVYTSLTASNRIRQLYLLAVLRQNISWFDTVGPGEVATRITSDTLLIQDAIGEKLPLAFAAISTFISGLVVAFTKSWQLTLVLLGMYSHIIQFL